MKMNWFLGYLAIVAALTVFNGACRQKKRIVESVYQYIEPKYSTIQLNMLPDTVNFFLSRNTFNAIKSANVFSQDGIDYISFYDRRSESVNIYHFRTRLLVKRIRLKDFLDKKSLYKTTVYTRNFDSVFIGNQTVIYLIDSTTKVKKKIDLSGKSEHAAVLFDNTSTPVFKDQFLYASVPPSGTLTTLKKLRDWRVFYKIDMGSNEANLQYHLPELYRENLYSYDFLDYTFCFNNHGNFVLSFPADTNIYETNLDDYHVAYYAKSRFQTGTIDPISEEDLKDEGGYKQYKLRDAYGPIFFDPYRKRYLRHAKQKISMADYEAKKVQRKESVIIFDENFKIIGEHKLPVGFAFDTLLFTSDGNMYARVNARDEYALHFVRLEYKKNAGEPTQLTKSGK